MSRKAIITIVLASVIGLISIAGVIYGVASNWDEDPSLLKLCWIADPNGSNRFFAEYNISQCNERGLPFNPIILEGYSTPFKVNVDTPEAESEVEGALKDFNRRTKSNLFVMGGDDVLIQWGVAFMSEDSVGTCRHLKSNGRITGIITLRDVSNTKNSRAILLHELAHFVGLGHTTAPYNSLMNEQLNLDIPNWGLIVDSQMEFIRDTYGN